jgi:hypothetical protein
LEYDWQEDNLLVDLSGDISCQENFENFLDNCWMTKNSALFGRSFENPKTIRDYLLRRANLNRMEVVLAAVERQALFLQPENRLKERSKLPIFVDACGGTKICPAWEFKAVGFYGL